MFVWWSSRCIRKEFRRPQGLIKSIWGIQWKELLIGLDNCYYQFDKFDRQSMTRFLIVSFPIDQPEVSHWPRHSKLNHTKGSHNFSNFRKWKFIFSWLNYRLIASRIWKFQSGTRQKLRFVSKSTNCAQRRMETQNGTPNRTLNRFERSELWRNLRVMHTQITHVHASLAIR